MTETPLKLLAKIGRRKRVTFTFENGQFGCEWDPNMPSTFSKKERRDYVAARNNFCGEIGRVLGGVVLIVDQNGATALPPAI